MAQLPWSPEEWGLLFQASGSACLVMLPSTWQVLVASDRYLQLLRQPRPLRADLTLFELWTPAAQVPITQAALRSSLEHALTSQEPVLRSVPALGPSAQGAKGWLERTTPVRDAGGKVAYLIHALEGPFYLQTPELAAIRGELEARVRERTLELEQANERLLKEIAEHLKTERALRRSEEQLKQAQKLDALGRLAGGVAHDFNNLLSVMLGYSSSLFLEPGFSASVRGQIGEIKTAAERAAELTLQLLAFSRNQVLEPRVIDLNASLVGLEKMLKRVLGEDIELRLLLRPELGRVRVDPGQIEQVILNMVINARDAMPTGGSLSIETDNVELDDGYAREHLGMNPGPHVLMTVSDTGCGMDKATQARIFEPFFTTKESGKGTGLGLATAFGIIKQSAGSIWLYSEPGTGTTFKIYLPRVDAQAVGRAASDLAEQRGGNETVLVVEDEAQVRKLACSILQRAGYHVLEADDAQDALRLGEAVPIDLLITDVVMPKMSGRVLAERLLALRPAVKVLFMSGYTDDAVLRHGVVESGAAFLQKPLTPATLTRKVREVLDRKE
jgi:signal transduction histidine kinase